MKVSNALSIAGLLMGMSFGGQVHAVKSTVVAPTAKAEVGSAKGEVVTDKLAEGSAKGSKVSPEAVEIAAGIDEALRKMGLNRRENEPLDVKISSTSLKSPQASFTVTYQLPSTQPQAKADAKVDAKATTTASAKPKGKAAGKLAQPAVGVAVIKGVVTPSGHVVLGHNGDVTKLFAQLDLLLGDKRRRAAQTSSVATAAAGRPAANITVSSR